jgi:hypothetical protein
VADFLEALRLALERPPRSGGGRGEQALSWSLAYGRCWSNRYRATTGSGAKCADERIFEDMPATAGLVRRDSGAGNTLWHHRAMTDEPEKPATEEIEVTPRMVEACVSALDEQLEGIGVNLSRISLEILALRGLQRALAEAPVSVRWYPENLLDLK